MPPDLAEPKLPTRPGPSSWLSSADLTPPPALDEDLDDDLEAVLEAVLRTVLEAVLGADLDLAATAEALATAIQALQATQAPKLPKLYRSTLLGSISAQLGSIPAQLGSTRLGSAPASA